MFADHLQNALRALRNSPVLTLLMVLALGLGIAACMTTLTVYRVLATDPIPGKSGQLYEVQLDAGSMVRYQPGQEPQFQLTRFDAEALHREVWGVDRFDAVAQTRLKVAVSRARSVLGARAIETTRARSPGGVAITRYRLAPTLAFAVLARS